MGILVPTPFLLLCFAVYMRFHVSCVCILGWVGLVWFCTWERGIGMDIWFLVSGFLDGKRKWDNIWVRLVWMKAFMV